MAVRQASTTARGGPNKSWHYFEAKQWKKRKLGNGNLEVSSVGLGCMGMKVSFCPPEDKQEMISLIRTAVATGTGILTGYLRQ